MIISKKIIIILKYFKNENLFNLKQVHIDLSTLFQIIRKMHIHISTYLNLNKKVNNESSYNQQYFYNYIILKEERHKQFTKDSKINDKDNNKYYCI